MSPVSGGLTETTAPQITGSAETVRLSPGSIVGISSSVTVTRKLCELTFPLASVAVIVTVVSPTGKVEPLGWLLSPVAFGQLSETSGSSQETIAPQEPASAVCVMSVGTPLSTGSSSSTMVRVKLSLCWFPEASVAV